MGHDARRRVPRPDDRGRPQRGTFDQQFFVGAGSPVILQQSRCAPECGAAYPRQAACQRHDDTREQAVQFGDVRSPGIQRVRRFEQAGGPLRG